MTVRQIKWFGWKPDTPDHRDYHFRVTAIQRRNLPPAIDLRPSCVPHMNQLALGSCVGHGVTAVIRYVLIKEGVADRPLSRLQLYYDGRVLENTVKIDSGLTIRDGIKCAADIGVAVEPLWPYNISRFTQKPFQNVYNNALKFRALSYERVEPNATAIRTAIASGHPVVGGFNVFNQFLSDQCARDGIVTMPGRDEASVGGHCTYFVGYGQRSGYITSRNSWGPDWGDKGDFYIPEEYLEQQGSDYWIITKVGLK